MACTSVTVTLANDCIASTPLHVAPGLLLSKSLLLSFKLQSLYSVELLIESLNRQPTHCMHEAVGVAMPGCR